jgi:hypothetical protein
MRQRRLLDDLQAGNTVHQAPFLRIHPQDQARTNALQGQSQIDYLASPVAGDCFSILGAHAYVQGFAAFG